MYQDKKKLVFFVGFTRLFRGLFFLRFSHDSPDAENRRLPPQEGAIKFNNEMSGKVCKCWSRCGLRQKNNAVEGVFRTIFCVRDVLDVKLN